MAGPVIKVRLIEGSMSVATGRSHSVVIDRPVDKGGTDVGFLGGELVLAGEGGCFLSTLAAAAKGRGITLRHASATVHATSEDNPPRFSDVRLEVDIDADTDDETIAKLLQIAERGCIASNTLRDGTNLTVTRRSAVATA